MNLFIVFFCIVAAVIAKDYCSEKLCDGAKHIACDHNGKLASSCSGAKIIEIPDSMKKSIVEAHNEKRNLIAGGGDTRYNASCSMATMQWDDELAAMAALNVLQCKMAHDQCRNTEVFRYSGQNLYMSGTTGSMDSKFVNQSYIESVKSWFSEVNNCNQKFIDSYPRNYKGKAIGHFTVMMAERNTHLGCAGIMYKEAPFNMILIACNYATTNMIGFPIYNSCKQPASNCKFGKNTKYQNLCSESEKYNVNKWF